MGRPSSTAKFWVYEEKDSGYDKEMVMKMLGKGEESSNYIHVELEGVQEAKKLKLGQVVELTIRGTVSSIVQREWEEGAIAEVCLEDYESKLVPKNTSVFAQLAEDDDE